MTTPKDGVITLTKAMATLTEMNWRGEGAAQRGASLRRRLIQ
jgi:hypothetical protein